MSGLIRLRPSAITGDGFILHLYDFRSLPSPPYLRSAFLCGASSGDKQDRLDLTSIACCNSLSSMRLGEKECKAVVHAIRSRDPHARVVLFGSRANDCRRGGDIDLLVLSDKLGFRDEWPIRRDILDQIGWQRLDLIVRAKNENPDPISRIALETGVDL